LIPYLQAFAIKDIFGFIKEYIIAYVVAYPRENCKNFAEI